MASISIDLLLIVQSSRIEGLERGAPDVTNEETKGRMECRNTRGQVVAKSSRKFKNSGGRIVLFLISV